LDDGGGKLFVRCMVAVDGLLQAHCSIEGALGPAYSIEATSTLETRQLHTHFDTVHCAWADREIPANCCHSVSHGLVLWTCQGLFVVFHVGSLVDSARGVALSVWHGLSS